MGSRCHGGICGQFLFVWFYRYLVEDDDSEGENEVNFDTIGTIAEEDSSHKSEQNESGNENDGKNIRLDSDSDIAIVVINN